jgi:hypothetical protein
MEYDKRHGGAWDRGSADSYYHRPFRPHMYVAGTSTSPEITEDLMSDEDIAAYQAGYEWNELHGDKKSWD